jgi:hypothetical protein
MMQPRLPGLFVICDDISLEQKSIEQLADLYQRRNLSLSRDKSELLSDVAHHTYRSLFFMAFKSNSAAYRQAIFTELKDLLYNYLDPYIGDRLFGSSSLPSPRPLSPTVGNR